MPGYARAPACEPGRGPIILEWAFPPRAHAGARAYPGLGLEIIARAIPVDGLFAIGR
jgi:hypothetical protein